MERRLRVVAGARIHLGFHSIYDPLSQIAFGSMGIYVGGKNGGPRIVVEGLWKPGGSGLSLVGFPSDVSRNLKKVFDTRCKSVEVNINVRLREFFPRHVGLGSTTQITLAALQAIKRACGIRDDIVKLAELAGRGEVSGIGIHSFRRGGFVVDGGKRLSGDWEPVGAVPPLVSRLSMPSSLSLILVIPRIDYSIRESEEPNLYDKELLRRGARVSRLLKHYAFSYILPGLVHGDYVLFGRGVNALQEKVGQVFSLLQESVYATEPTRRAVEALRTAGALGAGQSSWGPLAYGITYSKQSILARVKSMVAKALDKEGVDYTMSVVSPNNRGAVISISD